MKNTNEVAPQESPNCTSSNWQKLSAFCRARWDALKSQLVNRLSAEFPEVQSGLVHLAVLEAEALASVTGVPYLVLPALAEEKVMGLRNWTIHQQAITRRSEMAFSA